VGGGKLLARVFFLAHVSVVGAAFVWADRWMRRLRSGGVPRWFGLFRNGGRSSKGTEGPRVGDPGKVVNKSIRPA
jgi:hypothetical protein